VPPEDRAKALGWLSAATSAGVMVGPLLGSQARHFGHSGPGYFAAVLCALNVLSAWLWLPESKKKPEPGAVEAKRRPLRKALLDVVFHPRASVSSLIWVYAIGMMAFMAMNGILALYLKDVYQITEYTIGYYYSYIGGVGVVMRAILLGPLVRRFGEVGVMRLGALSLVLGLTTLPLAGSIDAERPVRLLVLGLVVILVPIGTALLFPATTALVSWRASREETGQVMGVQQAMGSVARILGPLWATWIYARNVRYPFWISAALMLGVSVLTWRQKETKAVVSTIPGKQTA
jgi:MFS family permease